jgi:thiamine-monophosphate kinase
MMNQVRENHLIHTLTHTFPRSPLQINQLHGTDAELISVPEAGEFSIAVTVDTIAEEIAAGLYEDPYLIGWMTVMASMSDLAAVGANPLGVIISELLPGVGRVNMHRHLTRIGTRPGDLLFATGELGAGNGFALSVLGPQGDNHCSFRPVARLREGQDLPGLATGCMDSSDGVLATLDQLMRLNGLGFEIESGWEELLHPDARSLAGDVGIPEWFLLAGQHGEFELLFTLHPEDESQLRDHAARSGWEPRRLGRATGRASIVMAMEGIEIVMPTGEIRDVAHANGGSLQSNVAGLRNLHDRIMTNPSDGGDNRRSLHPYPETGKGRNKR